MSRFLNCIFVTGLLSTASAFAPLSCSPRTSLALKSTETATSVAKTLPENMVLLQNAAASKTEDSDIVVQALLDTEKQMRQQAKEDYPKTAENMLQNLNGDWRLVFTTGTIDTQKRTGRINYFPLKAIQSFDTENMQIENGIYVGDFELVKFQGLFEFNLKSRKVEFDFTKITLLNFLDVQLGKGEAAEMGAKSGLGSKNNVGTDRKAFFNWISANEEIATARGGGGGLALWKRVV